MEEVVAEGGVPITAVEVEIPENVPDTPEPLSPVHCFPVASVGPASAAPGVRILDYNEEEAFEESSGLFRQTAFFVWGNVGNQLRIFGAAILHLLCSSYFGK